MFSSRWNNNAIATKNDSINKSSSSPSSSSSTGDNGEREEMLKYSLLVEGDDEEGGDICLVLQDEEDIQHSSSMDTWCSDGRLAVVILNLMMLVRGTLILTFVFLEGSAAVMNQQDGNNNGEVTTTAAATTTFPIWNMFLLMMDLLVVLLVFVVPFVVGLLGALYYQKHMVLFASLGFLVYVVFDSVFDTTDVWAFFAVVRLLCYLCVASIFINELRRNQNRREIRNVLLHQATKENDCIDYDDNDKSDNKDNRYIIENV